MSEVSARQDTSDAEDDNQVTEGEVKGHRFLLTSLYHAVNTVDLRAITTFIINIKIITCELSINKNHSVQC